MLIKIESVVIEMKKLNSIKIVMISFFLVVFLVICGMYISAYRDYKTISKEWILVESVVTEAKSWYTEEEANPDADENYETVHHLRFTLHYSYNNNEYDNTLSISSRRPKGFDEYLDEGDEVLIYCNPSNPMEITSANVPSTIPVYVSLGFFLFTVFLCFII